MTVGGSKHQAEEPALCLTRCEDPLESFNRVQYKVTFSSDQPVSPWGGLTRDGQAKGRATVLQEFSHKGMFPRKQG